MSLFFYIKSVHFGLKRNISLTRTLIYNQENKSDTIAILFIKPFRNERRIEEPKIKKWLKVRLNGIESKICIEK